VDNMADAAAMCRAGGVHALYMACMKSYTQLEQEQPTGQGSSSKSTIHAAPR
jgi:hypothetical protein